MTKVYFEDMMRQQHRHVVDNMAFGSVQGIPYSIQLAQSGTAPVFLLRFALAQGGAAKALAALNGNPIDNIHCTTEGDVLQARLTPPDDFYAKSLLHSLFFAVGTAFAETGAAAPANCPLCNLPGCDCCAWLEEAWRPAHQSCIDSRLQLPEEDTKSTVQVSGSHWRGAVGAVLGAVVGAVPTFSWALGTGRVNAIFYAFIPLFSALFYRLLRGRASRNEGGLWVLAASLFMALALEQLWYWMALQNTLGFVPTFAQSIQGYWQSHTLFSAVREMLFSLLLLVLGFFPASVLLRWYAARGRLVRLPQRGAVFVRQSVQPLAGEGTTESGNDPPAGAGPAKASAAQPQQDNSAPPAKTKEH